MQNKQIKWGASYNVFDGIELLEASIDLIRPHVDFISVVYQTVSNLGNPVEDLQQEELLKSLVASKKVDKLIKYRPQFELGPHYNEVKKREIGAAASQQVGCHYHLSLDCDEFYLGNELQYVKQYYLDNQLEGGYCQMLTYYKSTKYILDPPEDYGVPLFFDISRGQNYVWNAPAPILCDPTRKMPVERSKIFDRSEIQMHHLSGVRKNYRQKISNSSAVINYRNQVDELVEAYESFDFDRDPRALCPGLSHVQYTNLKQVDDLFGINY